ncbi:hypothetical protein MMY95_15750, partial [Lactiplantibacillus sp. ME-2]|uniref:hypothetical protein n=1 Tax=Lactiplantibacillus sp. ME-2 TaxID=2923377 RepID=UPI001F4AAEFA
PATVDLDNGRGVAPDLGLDFFYEGSKVHFVWQANNHNMNNPDSNGYYYPYTGQLFYWNTELQNIQCLHYKERAYEILNV